MKKSYYFLSLLCVVLIALNLRAPITVIGSVAHDVQDIWQLSDSTFGALGGMPLFCFFIFALIAPFFARTKAMIAALILLFAGLCVRSAAGSVALFIGTAAIGAGIAVLNVMMPSFIKRNFAAKVAPAMALYSLTLSLSSLVGVFGHYLTPWLNARWILAIFAIVVLAAAISFVPFVRNHRWRRGESKMSVKDFAKIFKNPKAWVITAFMGLQSCVFYTVINWYLIILKDRLGDSTLGANIVVVFQVAAIFSAFFVPLLMSKLQQIKSKETNNPLKMKDAFKPSTLLLHVVCASNVIALGLLLFGGASVAAAVASALLFSLPVGGVFGVALSMIATKAKSAQTTIYLSAMAQSVGYLIAAFGPWVFGLVASTQAFGVRYGASILMLAAVSVALWVAAIFSNKITEI